MAVAVGTLLGALLGGEVGRSMDAPTSWPRNAPTSRPRPRRSASRSHGTIPDNGHYGSVTPVREGTHDQTGEYCREFQQTVTIGGRPENAYGVACRQPDGAWRIVQ